MKWLLLLWPLSGWFLGWLAMPAWMLRRDRFGWVVIGACGAVVGPIGICWLFSPFGSFTDIEDKMERAETKSVRGFFLWIVETQP